MKPESQPRKEATPPPAKAGASPLPAARVPTPEQAEAALGEDVQLPDDETEAALFAEQPAKQDPSKVLPGVVVGKTLAENLELQLGDVVRIVSPLAGLDTTFFGSDTTAPSALDFRVTGIFEVNLSTVSYRLNQVMKLLTVMSTIFLPLTVLTGMWGMNIPLPHFPGGAEAQFWWVSGIMVTLIAAMLVVFRHNKWI